MYDENDLYNELVGTGKKGVQAVKSAIDIGIKLKSFIDEPQHIPVQGQLAKTNHDFVFTGQGTDLRYFAEYSEMPIGMIESIQDERLKNAVKDELNKAALAGRVKIDNKTGKITITESGRAYISKPEFRSAAAADSGRSMSLVQERSTAITYDLNGTLQDLGVFKHTEVIDLKDIMAAPDKEAVQNVLSNLVKFRDSGLISLEESAVKITEKGRKVLESQAFKAASKAAIKEAATHTSSAIAGAATGGVGGVAVEAAEKVVSITIKAAKTLTQSMTQLQR